MAASKFMLHGEVDGLGKVHSSFGSQTADGRNHRRIFKVYRHFYLIW